MIDYKNLKIESAKIRRLTLKMLQHIGYGHIGGSLSIVELMSVLYGSYLKHDPNNPSWEGRDYVILSKGHSGPGWYATLANFGYFDESWLYTLNQGATNLPSHPDRHRTPGVDMTTGSLGQGISVAAGVGLAFKLNGTKQKVVAIVGDGELNEGQCWEAFQFISHHKMSNVKVIIDENKKQLDGLTTDIINPYSLEEKMNAFGFFTQVVKGDNEREIFEALQQSDKVKDRAVCIILDSIKGQGVKHFEDMLSNHSVNFSEEDNIEINKAIEELEKIIS